MGVSEWVEFNAPLDTIYVISEAGYLKWYLNPELSVIKLLKIRLYNRPRVADKHRPMLIMVPGCLGTKSQRNGSKMLILKYVF